MVRKFILLLVFLGIAVSSQAQATQPKWRVEFEGNKIFSSDILLEKLNLNLAKYVESQDKYDAALFNHFLRKDVLDFLRNRGYLTAKIAEPIVQKGDQGLKVIVSIEEGRLYRLGRVDIQGAKVFTSEQLLEKLNLKRGDIATTQELHSWLSERTKKLYEDNGYIQSSYEAEPTFKPNAEKEGEGIVDLQVAIDEGKCFVISEIAFLNNRETPDHVLRSALLIKEGERFSQHQLAESIEKLNHLGLFTQIYSDRDIELIINEENSTLKITIRVEHKKSNQN